MAQDKAEVTARQGAQLSQPVLSMRTLLSMAQPAEPIQLGTARQVQFDASPRRLQVFGESSGVGVIDPGGPRPHRERGSPAGSGPQRVFNQYGQRYEEDCREVTPD